MNPWLPLATWFLQALSDWMRLKPSMDTTALLNRMINSSCCTQNTLVNAWHSYVSFVTVCMNMQPNEVLAHVCTHQQGWGGGWVCVSPPPPLSFLISYSVPQSYEMCYTNNTSKQHNWLYLTTNHICLFPPYLSLFHIKFPWAMKCVIHIYIYIYTFKQHNWLYLTVKSPEDDSDSESVNSNNDICAEL